MPYLLKSTVKTVLALLIISAPVLPVLSKGTTAEAIKLYQAKDYKGASGIFAELTKQNPKLWQEQYYLGNCYTAMGQPALAKAAYNACLAVCSDAAAKAQCAQALAALDRYTRPVRTESSAMPAKAANSAADDDEDITPDPSSPKARAQKLKDEIMQTAKEQVAKIRKAASEQIQTESKQSNTICDYPDGHSALDIPYQRVDEINREAEEKCAKIMNEAELRCRGIR